MICFVFYFYVQNLILYLVQEFYMQPACVCVCVCVCLCVLCVCVCVCEEAICIPLKKLQEPKCLKPF
jgi:hypothetical protein